MQNYSEKVKISNNEKLGRHLVASIDLAPGEVILKETPLLVAPHWECQQMKCSQCMQDSFLMCKKCHFFPLCMDCTEHDEFDCNFFSTTARHISRNLLVENYGIFAALKLLLLMENPQTSARCEPLHVQNYKLAAMKRRCDSVLWQELAENVVAPLLRSGIANTLNKVQLTAELLHAICLRIDENAFEITAKDGDSLKGVYVCGAQLPHSCVPNTVISFDDDSRMHVYASVPLHNGDILYNSYTNPLMGTSQRRHELWLSKHIDCDCARCSDPTELGTHMSSLKCQQCVDGYVLNSTLQAPGVQRSNWQCNTCAATVTATDVNELLACVGEQLLEANGDLHAYELLLQKYAALLHANHFVLLDIKQHIATILRGVLMNPMCVPGKRLLQRKLKLCDELLPVVRAVQPGISKLYGIALYEYLLSYVELAELEYEEQTTQDAAELFRQKLEKANEIANNAKQMLCFEPRNSPEGHLLRRIAKEQKRIDDNLQQLAEKGSA